MKIGLFQTYVGERISSNTLNNVVSELIGCIQPVGESDIDSKRFVAMQIEMNLIDVLLEVILFFAEKKSSHEYSVRKASTKALEYFREKQKWIEEVLNEVSE